MDDDSGATDDWRWPATYRSLAITFVWQQTEIFYIMWPQGDSEMLVQQYILTAFNHLGLCLVGSWASYHPFLCKEHQKKEENG
jgi:hypothetical protein